MRVRKREGGGWQKELEERVNCYIEMIEKATSSLQPLILMPEIHVDHKLACCQAMKHPLLLSSSSALRPHPVFRASSEVHSQLEVRGRCQQAAKPLRPAAPASCSLCGVMRKPARQSETSSCPSLRVPPPSGALARMKASWVEERAVQMRCLVRSGKSASHHQTPCRCITSSKLLLDSRWFICRVQQAVTETSVVWLGARPSSIGVIASFASMLVCTGLEFRRLSEALCAYRTDHLALRKDDDDSPAECL